MVSCNISKRSKTIKFADELVDVNDVFCTLIFASSLISEFSLVCFEYELDC